MIKNKHQNTRFPQAPNSLCRVVILTVLLKALSVNAADEPLGFSITGDKESPGVLYLVPWKAPNPPNEIRPPLPELAPIELLDRNTLQREQRYFMQVQTLQPAHPASTY
jgi:hypothetical protein